MTLTDTQVLHAKAVAMDVARKLWALEQKYPSEPLLADMHAELVTAVEAYEDQNGLPRGTVRPADGGPKGP